MVSPSPLGLPRERRLRRRRDFLYVQRTGARGNGEALTVVGRPVRGGGPGRVGFTVPKKVGKAHVRNLVKRRLRHLMRARKQAFEGRDLILIAHPQAATLSFEELEADLERALARFDENARRPRSSRRRPPKPQKKSSA